MKQPKLYYYGVWLTEPRRGIGKRSVFVCTKKTSIPNSAILVNQGTMLDEEAYKLANELKDKEQWTRKFLKGDIIIYADKYGQHTGIVLKKGETESTFLFVTSNPNWGRMARRITRDEEALLGYPNRGRTSFFVPVVRPNVFAIETGKSYSSYRIEELIEEFGV